MSKDSKRIKLVAKTANPLFEKWMLELIENALEEEEAEQLQNALESLRKFPILLKNGSDCIILEHFDNNLCRRLDEKLQIYNTELLKARVENSDKNEEFESHPNKDEELSDHHVAVCKILVTLLDKEIDPTYKGFLRKAELQTETQLSMKNPHTLGSTSLSTLISKGLVENKNHKYSLSSSGKQLATKLKVSNNKRKFLLSEFYQFDVQDIIAPSSRSRKENISNVDHGNQNGKEIDEKFTFLPYTFEIILLVDTAETTGSSKTDDPTTTLLKKHGVNFEVRHLNVGDYLWIARDESGKELVLPYIVERKRKDDLSSSIKDGRFHEQKFRLKHCGLKNIIYLVEDYKMNGGGLPATTLMQAVVNTMVIEKFTLKFTNNHKESMLYLNFATDFIMNEFKAKTLKSCTREEIENEDLDLGDSSCSLMPFKTFSSGMSKRRNYTVKEMFLKQLIQLHGMSVDKALAIVDIYPNPKSLITAFLSSGPLLLANIEYGLLNRKIGPVISRVLHSFYTLRTFPS
ncbi:crossover junction endonuclease MUS81 [Cimex lectularius]|uniref:Crossover junction endonuclease MUS81 n=1 Tax=Cimex lectularius TaxID=79782 RepID=A0A8I6RT91_CIMLE|nr:crossover junction endonuclease MUS81 [Cimex lectularius]